MESAELLKITGRMPDSVTLGVAALRAALTSTERFDLLDALLTESGSFCTPRDLRELAQLGRDLEVAEPGEAGRLCAQRAGDGPRARWLVAAILEGHGRHGDAAGVLAAIRLGVG